MESNLTSIFGLTKEQTKILFSLQSIITSYDVSASEKEQKIKFHSKSAPNKRIWLGAWKNAIEKYLENIGCDQYVKLCDDDSELKHLVSTADAEAKNKIWKYLVLLECVLYTPYYPIDQDEEAYKQFKSLKVDKTAKTEALKKICSILGITEDYIYTFEKAYKKSIRSLSGYWSKVFAGAAIAVVVVLAVILTFQAEIIALFAAQGLSGAAAVSSGLAALGGGAIAAGGMGMAGGMVVLIGGGSLLGIASGSVIGHGVASLGSGAVLVESAKMQVVLKEIVLAIQKDTIAFQEILFNLNKQASQLRDELIKLKFQQEENKKKIKDLEKTLKYLEKLLNTNAQNE